MADLFLVFLDNDIEDNICNSIVSVVLSLSLSLSIFIRTPIYRKTSGLSRLFIASSDNYYAAHRCRRHRRRGDTLWYVRTDATKTLTSVARLLIVGFRGIH